MKLVQKKCPNCGANLSFNENAKKVTCEYCKQKFIIEKEVNSTFDTDDFKFRVAKYYENKAENSKKNFSRIWIAFLIIGTIILYFVCHYEDIMKDLEKASNSNSNSNSSVEKDTYVTDISQIDQKSLELFHEETLKELKNENVFVPSNTIEGNWEYVGMYLLNSKKETLVDCNILYDIYKKQYVVNGDVLITYAGVRYKGLKLSDDGIVLTSFDGYKLSPMRFFPETTSSFIYGYESVEDFYNKVLRERLGEYTITGTEGMYLESK